MSNTLIQLGSIRFAIDAVNFEEIERKSGWRWPSHDVINDYPVHQYVGPDEPEITFSGEIMPSLVARLGGDEPIGQLTAVRNEANRGVPLQLVDAMGRNWGEWVIVKVQETQSHHLSNAAPRRQVYQITIRFYGRGEPGG